MRPPQRARWLTAGVLLGLTACSPSPAVVATPKVSPTALASPSSAPPPTATAVPSPAPSRLPGASFGLPALPPGVAFTGKLLIADRGHGRIIEINARGVVDW
ncbi:MAG TPA: hypothetical protein VND54_01965, partial [Candidatus Saccharimonadales bacterium]|nr:hypothetical protein [Candidatus Saccharimonadales bacterium]